jgi:hypothetical protein
MISLSNVALVGYLGVRSLTEEEQLYIRLSRLGKYLSTGEEICTLWVCLDGEKWVKSYCSTFRFYLTNIIQP